MLSHLRSGLGAAGHMYTWGCGEKGKLGHQDMKDSKVSHVLSSAHAIGAPEPDTGLAPTRMPGADARSSPSP